MPSDSSVEFERPLIRQSSYHWPFVSSVEVRLNHSLVRVHPLYLGDLVGERGPACDVIKLERPPLVVTRSL